MESSKLCRVLLLVAMGFTLSKGQTDIFLRAQYQCNSHQNNDHILMEVVAYDSNGIAVRLNAINNDKNEILSCAVFGDGTEAAPFRVTSVVDTTDGTEDNGCGMRIIQSGGIQTYTWQFKAYSYPLGSTQIRKGSILTVRCPENDVTNGFVETRVDIEVNNFAVIAADPSQVTGENAVATNANIIYEVNVVPNGDDTEPVLQDAVGIYAHSCYSSTNENMMANREMFIDAYGCRVPGAQFSPTTSFVDVSSGEDILTIRAQYATATVVNNQKVIYLTCELGKCTVLNDPSCPNRCNASRNGLLSQYAVDTGVQLATYVTVQDRYAQVLEVTDSQNNAISTIEIGNSFRLVSYHTPFGIGATSDLNDATGFYVYNCRYAFNANMNSAEEFIGNDGCPVTNSILSTASGFVYDAASSSLNLNPFVLKSGLIVAEGARNRRLWIRCDTGKCIIPGHIYCIPFQRCGANDNIPGAVDLGYRGQETKLSILDVINEPAISIAVVDVNGNVIDENNSLTVGDDLQFGMTITPGGTGTGGNSFDNVKGVYVYSCYLSPTDDLNQKDFFIDRNGCPIDDSPYKPSETCRDVTAVQGVPPFEIDCGVITIPDVGTFRQICSFGLCYTANNPACINRCNAGPLEDQSNVSQPQGLTSSTPDFQSSLPEVISTDRTATKSEELRNTIAAVSVVCAVLLLLIVAIGTCLIVKSQKKRAKQYSDSRSYNY